jgi:DNA-binding CsgD family transcriptional regulator
MLRERDLHAVLELAGEAHDASDLDDFRGSVLPALCRIAPSDYASYNELDRDLRPMVAIVQPELPHTAREAWARLAAQNPLVQYYARTRDGRPFRWSDVCDAHTLRATDLFRELYAPIGVQHQIAFTLPSPSHSTIAIALSRGGRDYTDAERELLRLVRPHLIQAYRHAELREGLGSLVDGVRRGLDAGATAVVVVTASGEVALVTDAACDLAELAGAGPIVVGEPLPAAFATRPGLVSLRSGDGDTILVRHARGSRGETIVLLARGSRALSVEALRGLGLTVAEAAVLHALARGLSTADAAAELSVSPRTVHKHMQRVNAKLGVTERGQAIATAWAAAGT